MEQQVVENKIETVMTPIRSIVIFFITPIFFLLVNQSLNHVEVIAMLTSFACILLKSSVTITKLINSGRNAPKI